jgi:pimeloyl-ACP methyl ester carboxylesterase/DNA-binding CsgD family transcriptional regulator
MPRRHHHDEIRFACTREGVRIALARSGSGYPLIKASNWMTHIEHDWTSPVWGPWLAALCDRFTLVRYDSRGCGLSDRSAQDASLAAFIADMEAVIEASRLDRVAILGMGQGGAVAVSFAARHPDKVSHLVLTGAYVRGALKRDPSPEVAETVQAMTNLVELGWGQENPAFRQLFSSHIFPLASLDQMHSLNELQRTSTSPQHAARLLAEWSAYDASAALAGVKCPTLVMHCRGDARVPIEEARFIAASIRDARFQALDTRNHLPLPQEPAFDQFIAAISGFLPASPARGEPAMPFRSLTPREREILALIAQGLSNTDIAEQIGLSGKTVRNNITSIFDKLGVASRARAIVRAREAGFR